MLKKKFSSNKRLGVFAGMLIAPIAIILFAQYIADYDGQDRRTLDPINYIENKSDSNKINNQKTQIMSITEKLPDRESEVEAYVSPETDIDYFTSEPELPLDDSPDMEDWKAKNFMPDLHEEAAYLNMDISALRDASERGDVLAQSALGNRLVRQGHDHDSGVDWLVEAASHGSQEALRTLRWIYQFGAGSIEPDQYAFLAWSRVSFMLGDWQALWPFGTQAMSEIGVRNSIIVEVMTANFFAEINRRHFDRTGENMRIVLRPGYEQALEQFLNEEGNMPP